MFTAIYFTAMTHVTRPHKNAIPLEVTHEAWLVVFGFIAAILLVRLDFLGFISVFAAQYATIASFVVGAFFTSILTTTPAIVAIAEFSAHIPPLHIALVGGIGAVCGDLLIFRFVRSPLATYIVASASNKTMVRIGRIIAKSPFWWIVPVMGAAIIASPLPDELGLIMMGLSSIRLWAFLPISYAMNTLGIYLIAVAAQALHVM